MQVLHILHSVLILASFFSLLGGDLDGVAGELGFDFEPVLFGLEELEAVHEIAETVAQIVFS